MTLDSQNHFCSRGHNGALFYLLSFLTVILIVLYLTYFGRQLNYLINTCRDYKNYVTNQDQTNRQFLSEIAIYLSSLRNYETNVDFKEIIHDFQKQDINVKKMILVGACY